jgi:hypothetical protein
VGTPLTVVPYVEPYLDLINEGSLIYATAHGTPPEQVDLLAAICLRESLAGRALRPQTPDGTGDWTVRTGGWTKRMGVRSISDTRASREWLRENGWSIPRREGQTVPGPYAIPLDGRGWGRGLFQLDALGDQRDLIAPAPWAVEYQATAACAQLALAREQLEPYKGHPLYASAVVARYNASLDRVRAGLLAGNPDIGTTGGDYSRDVESLRLGVRARWPDRFKARVA